MKTNPSTTVLSMPTFTKLSTLLCCGLLATHSAFAEKAQVTPSVPGIGVVVKRNRCVHGVEVDKVCEKCNAGKAVVPPAAPAAAQNAAEDKFSKTAKKVALCPHGVAAASCPKCKAIEDAKAGKTVTPPAPAKSATEKDKPTEKSSGKATTTAQTPPKSGAAGESGSTGAEQHENRCSKCKHDKKDCRCARPIPGIPGYPKPQ